MKKRENVKTNHINHQKTSCVKMAFNEGNRLVLEGTGKESKNKKGSPF